MVIATDDQSFNFLGGSDFEGLLQGWFRIYAYACNRARGESGLFWFKSTSEYMLHATCVSLQVLFILGWVRGCTGSWSWSWSVGVDDEVNELDRNEEVNSLSRSSFMNA